MKINVKIDDKGLQNVQKKAKKIVPTAQSALKQIGEQQVEQVKLRIRSSKTAPDGRSWAPWSLATIKQRVREGTHSQGLLWRTGALLSSIQYRIQQMAVQIFSSVRYANFIQFGTRKMPARPFIGIDTKQAVNTIREKVKEVL